MQVFEFHFNPKEKPDLIFNGFCFEPQNIYEKRLGGLYLAGALKNALPQNFHLLEHLTQTIKQQYYKNSLRNPAKALQEGLKLGNNFLENISKKGDVSWLGHLDFAALSLKNLDLNFTKTGEIKIYLLRGGQVIDIDNRLKFEEIDPYPLKIFGNIISGKLAEDDIILVLTEELLSPFQPLLAEIAGFAPFDGKKLRDIFKKKEEILSKTSGLCLLISLSKTALPRKKEMILGSPKRKEFAFKNIISPIFKKLKKFKKPVFKLPRFPAQKKEPQKAKQKEKNSKAVMPAIKIPSISSLISIWKIRKKNVILILFLILFLAIGFFISHIEESRKLKTYQETLLQIQQRTNEAESYLIAKNNPLLQEKANSLLRESRNNIADLIKISSTAPASFKDQASDLENKIFDKLFALNKLTEIEDPELIFEANPQEFIPQKIISGNNSLYLFSPYAPNILKINENKERSFMAIDRKINAASAISSGILLFFSKPDIFTILKDDKFYQAESIRVLSGYIYNSFSSYQSNLYFLDEKNGQIIKYSYLGNNSWNPPQAWLFSSTEKPIDAKSIAVSGSVWILTKDNSIARYYAGQLQETLKINIFPAPKNFSKILAIPGLSYIYILEPQQKRVVITNRTGEIIRQFQSDKFSNLLDFAVSQDGKAIYLLNGLKVYKILL